MATGLDKVVDEKGVDELLEILNDIAGKWEQFLSQLKVSESKRQQIKTDHRESQLCLMYGLHEWRKSNERPTYQMIVDALRSSFVGCQELAMRIEDKLGMYTCIACSRHCMRLFTVKSHKLIINGRCCDNLTYV